MSYEVPSDAKRDRETRLEIDRNRNLAKFSPTYSTQTSQENIGTAVGGSTATGVTLGAFVLDPETHIVSVQLSWTGGTGKLEIGDIVDSSTTAWQGKLLLITTGNSTTGTGVFEQQNTTAFVDGAQTLTETPADWVGTYTNTSVVTGQLVITSASMIIDDLSGNPTIKTIHGAKNDGQFTTVKPLEGKTLTVASGGNIDTAGFTVADSVFATLQFHEDNITPDASGSWTVALAASGGGTSPPFSDSTDLLKGSGDDTKLLRFEIDGFTASTTRTITVPDSSTTMAGLGVINQTWTGTNDFVGITKVRDGTNYFMQNIADNTKQVDWDLSAITTATTRTITMPDADITLGAGGGGPEFADDVFRVTGSADATKKLAFEVDGFATATTRTVTVPNSTFIMAGLQVSQTWTGENIFAGLTDMIAVNFSIIDFTDNTKELRWDVSGITTGTVRTITVPDSSTTMAGLGVINQTWTGTNIFVGPVQIDNDSIIGSSNADTVTINGKTLQVNSRHQYDKGTDEASASQLTLADDGNVFDITGTTTINTISPTNWQAGSVIHLQFDGILTVTHDSGGTNDILLGNQSNMTTATGDVLSLFFNGIDWVEISRSVIGIAGVTDIITEGDTSVEVIDAGVGIINFTVDNFLVGFWNVTRLEMFADIDMNLQRIEFNNVNSFIEFNATNNGMAVANQATDQFNLLWEGTLEYDFNETQFDVHDNAITWDTAGFGHSISVTTVGIDINTGVNTDTISLLTGGGAVLTLTNTGSTFFGDLDANTNDIVNMGGGTIFGLTTVTAVAGDFVMIRDATDSALKKVDASDFLGGGGLPHSDGEGATTIIQNTGDTSKVLRFDLGEVTTSGIKTFHWLGGGSAVYDFPNNPGEIMVGGNTQTISGNKTFSSFIDLDNRLDAHGGIRLDTGTKIQFDNALDQTYILESTADNMEFHVDTTDSFFFFAEDGDTAGNEIFTIQSDGTLLWKDGHEIVSQGVSLDLGVGQTTDVFKFFVDQSATPELAFEIQDDLVQKVGAAFQRFEIYNTLNASDNTSIGEYKFEMDNEGGSKTSYATIAGYVHDAGTVLGDREGGLQFLVTHGSSNSTIYAIEGGESNTSSRIGWYNKALSPASQQSVGSDTLANLYTALRNYGLIA